MCVCTMYSVELENKKNINIFLLFINFVGYSFSILTLLFLCILFWRKNMLNPGGITLCGWNILKDNIYTCLGFYFYFLFMFIIFCLTILRIFYNMDGNIASDNTATNKVVVIEIFIVFMSLIVSIVVHPPVSFVNHFPEISKIGFLLEKTSKGGKRGYLMSLTCIKLLGFLSNLDQWQCRSMDTWEQDL